MLEYPEDPLFQLANRKEGTGDDYVVPPGQMVGDNVIIHHATNAPVVNTTEDILSTEESDDKNIGSANEQKNLDLFEKPHILSLPQQPAVQTQATLIKMLDWELTLTFSEPTRRLLRSYSSSHRQHRQAQIQARNVIVKDVLTKFLNEFYLNELFGRRYAPLDQVVVNNGKDERVIVSKSSVTNELYDLSSTSTWFGVTVFIKTEDMQRLPTEFTVQAIQLQALDDEAGVLFDTLKEADTGDIAGLDRLESIKASILPPPSLSYDTNRLIEGEFLPLDSVPVDQSIALPSQQAGFDTIVSVALIIASFSFALLATTLFVAYRRSQTGQMHPRNGRTTKHEVKESHWRVRDARPDQIPPTNSGCFNAIASSTSLTEGVQIYKPTDGEDADDEMSLPRQLPDAVESTDRASESACSDVSSLGNVIKDAIQAYQTNTGILSSSTPESLDTFFFHHRVATSGRDEEESVGVASIDDSSQLGAISVGGYSLANNDSTK